jgi:hypothetical protein
MAGASAKVEPHTRTSAICIEKASNPHTPLPQLVNTSKGVCRHTGIATANEIKVSNRAKMKGSGKYLCTKRTLALTIFLNIIQAFDN